MTIPNDRREIVATQCACCGSRNLKKSPAVLMPFVAHRAMGWGPVKIDSDWGLQTVPEGMAFSICNSVFCDDCGFLFLDIRFSDSELSALYADYRGEEYTALREKYEPGYTLRNDRLNAGINFMNEVEAFISPHLSLPATILDWGGDTGKNTPFRDGRNAIDVYDISDKECLEGVRRVSLDVLQDKRYDLIVNSHVLEHVPYPAEMIRDMAAVMDEDTVLYIELPYEDIMSRAKGARDLHLKKRHWHEHINFFSKESLEAMFKANGLKQVGYRELTADGGAHCAAVFQIACKLAPRA